MVGVSNAVFHERIDAFEDVFPRTGDDLGHDLHEEFIAIARGAAIVGLEDQPAICGSENPPLIPIGVEVIAVGIGGAAVDERECWQILSFKLSWRTSLNLNPIKTFNVPESCCFCFIMRMLS